MKQIQISISELVMIMVFWFTIQQKVKPKNQTEKFSYLIMQSTTQSNFSTNFSFTLFING